MNLASSLGIHSFKLIEYLVKIYLFSLKDFTENVLETHTQTGRERERDQQTTSQESETSSRCPHGCKNQGLEPFCGPCPGHNQRIGSEA